MTKKILFLGVLCLITSTVLAQNLYELPSFWDNYLINNYGVDDGILSQQVYKIHPDEEGYVWLISNRQLLQFDGLQIREKRKGNIGGTLYDVVEDEEGILWIPSIGSGLYKFIDDSLESLAVATGDLVKSIEIINDTLYLGMYGEGLKVFNGNTVIQHFSTTNGLVGDEVWVLRKDNEGNLWVGTNTGLSIYKDGVFTNFTTENGLSYDNIRSIEVLENGEVWVGTDNEGIVIFKDQQPVRYLSTNDGLTSGIINSILELENDVILIGTLGGGLLRYDGTTFDQISLDDGLISDNINTIYANEHGVIFVGTEDGLSVLIPRLFHPITIDGTNIFIDEAVTLNENADNQLWVGTYGIGYRYWQNSTWNSIENPPNKTNGYAQSGAIDLEGNLWVGTQGSGIFKIEDSDFISKYTTENGLLDNYTRGITFDLEGNLWAGSNKGITVFSPQGIVIDTYSEVDEIPNPFCITMLTASDGSIWYGSFGGGVVRFKDGQKTIYDTSKGLRSDQVLSIFEDSNSDIWIGTFNYGISRVVGDSLITFGPESGLPEGANVAGIVEDDNKTLWLATGNGVITIDLKSFEEYENGEMNRIPFHYYSIEDGLISDNLQAGNNSTVLKHSDGNLFFASIDGVSVIDPDGKLKHEGMFKPYITELSVDGAPVLERESIVFGPDQNKIEISFSAINFETPGKTDFRVRLTGVDEDWVYMDSRTTTYYDFLPEGDYAFTVSAIGQDGQWSNETASINFSVLPPFYKTWWFISLCLIGFGSIIAGGIRIYYRAKVNALNRELETQQKIHKERERISRDLHDNVGSQITNLITGLEISQLHFQKNESDKAMELLSDLDADARGAMTELRETIWLMDKEEIPASIFTDHLKGYIRRQSRYLPNTKTSVSINGEITKILKPAESLNIMRIIQESLNNTRKYAEAATFSISFQQNDDRFLIKIEDDGKGMKVEEVSSLGNGLQNMRFRAEEIEAKLRIHSSPDNGTAINIEL